jgi:hypothetical protein
MFVNQPIDATSQIPFSSRAAFQGLTLSHRHGRYRYQQSPFTSLYELAATRSNIPDQSFAADVEGLE